MSSFNASINVLIVLSVFFMCLDSISSILLPHPPHLSLAHGWKPDIITIIFYHTLFLLFFSFSSLVLFSYVQMTNQETGTLGSTSRCWKETDQWMQLSSVNSLVCFPPQQQGRHKRNATFPGIKTTTAKQTRHTAATMGKKTIFSKHLYSASPSTIFKMLYLRLHGFLRMFLWL